MADLIPEDETQFDNARAADDIPEDPNRSSTPEAGNPLFPSEQCRALGDEWQAIQAAFVDAPRESVQKADALVKKTVGILESSFAQMHNCLEQNWEKNSQVSTEDLRLALKNYRSFFHRLLSI